MAAAEPWVWLARIRRTQGRKGEVFADILTDFPEKFAERKRLWLLRGTAPPAGTPRPAAVLDADQADDAAAREVELVAHWQHKGGIVLHFAGVDSISDAEKLAGLAPNMTALALVKPLPLMVTVVPPASGPAGGDTDETDGAGT